MLLKGSTQYDSKLETQQWPQDWKRSVFIPIPKKTSAKNVQTNTQLCLFQILAM